MKKSIISTFIIALAATCAGHLQAGAPKADAAQYFSDYIAGKAAAYSSKKSIKRSEIADARQSVWAEWQKAVRESSELPLPELQRLSDVSSHEWKIPASLEPNATMPFYWGYKSEAEPSGDAPLPLFIYLHGSGPKEHEWSTGLILAKRFDDAPSAYFIPQIPNEGEYYRWWQKGKQYAWNNLLRRALASETIDPNRIYMFGISEGGYGSQRLASFYADYLAGAGPMAGGEPLKNAPTENLRNTAFSLLTGDKDLGFYRNKLTGYTKRSLDSLKALCPDAYVNRVELIPDRGHAIDYSPTTPWLKQFTRNAHPKKIKWEDFDMDGWHRSGFYNLYVDRRPDEAEGARAYYEMSIEGNEIDLNVSTVTYTTIETDPQWGIALDFSRSYEPARSGVITVYLDENLVDLDRAVTLRVNGRRVHKGKLKLRMENMVNSCARFFDPERLYPAAITVDLADL